jgi:hypothetical protein
MHAAACVGALWAAVEGHADLGQQEMMMSRCTWLLTCHTLGLLMSHNEKGVTSPTRSHSFLKIHRGR